MKKIKKIGVPAILALSACFSAYLCMTPNKASADEPTSDNVGTFEMVEGASVTLSQEGLRFIVKMDETVYDSLVTNDAEDAAKLSFWVAPANLFDAVSGDYSKLTDKIVIKVSENLIYKIDGNYYANGTYEGVSNQEDLKFAAVAVIESTDGVRFADGLLANNTRSVYDVLKAATLDSEEDYYESILGEDTPYNWFATSEYPLMIDTMADYENLIKTVNAGANFEDKYVYRNNELILSDATVELAPGKTMPTLHADFNVKFLEADGTEIKTIKVPLGEGISEDTLQTIVPKEVEGKVFNGWDIVSDVQSNLTFTAKYSDVYTVSFKTVDGEELGVVQVKENDFVTQEQLDEIESNLPDEDDKRFKGWATDEAGTDVSASITTTSVTANVTYYALFESMKEYTINVHVANYEWFLEGERDKMPEKYAAFTAGGVIGYVKDSNFTYAEKTEQFNDLVSGSNKAFAGDKVDLTSFFASLNACYSVNEEQTTDWENEIVADDTVIDVYLDWNEEALGFAPTDVIYAEQWAPMSLGLTRDPKTGIAGMGFEFTSDIAQATDARIFLKNGTTKDSYQAVMVKFSYVSSVQVLVRTPLDRTAQTGYASSSEHWKTYIYDVIGDNANDDVRSVALCPQGAGRTATLIIESITYVESGSKTYEASDLIKLSMPSYGGSPWDAFYNPNDKIALAKDADGVDVLRYTTTGIDQGDLSWLSLGELLRFGNVNFDDYSSIKVKFKTNQYTVLWYGCNNSPADVACESSEEVYEVDLKTLTFNGKALTGEGVADFMIGVKLAQGASLQIDVYSVEFVAKN